MNSVSGVAVLPVCIVVVVVVVVVCLLLFVVVVVVVSPDFLTDKFAVVVLVALALLCV